MSDVQGPPPGPSTRRRRSTIGMGVGTAAGASTALALFAVAAPIAAALVESPRDTTSSSVFVTSAAGVLAGLCVLLALAPRLCGREGWAVAIKAVTVFAVALGARAAWDALGMMRRRSEPPMVDSTGATVIVTAGLVAAVTATVVFLAAFRFLPRMSRRAAACCFAVAAIAAPLLTFGTVEHYRAGVWKPELIATASPPPARPNGIEAVRYRITLGDGRGADVGVVGSGFYAYTVDAVVAYDGGTGEVRWRAGRSGGSGPIRDVRVAWRNRDDAAGVVVLVFGDAMIGLDGGTGSVVWRRQYHGKVTAAVGSVDALGVAIWNPEGDSWPGGTSVQSLDPGTGALRWQRLISCSNPSAKPGAAGQFSIQCSGDGDPSMVDARRGQTIELPESHHWTLVAGPDAYASTSTDYSTAPPTPAEATVVTDANGQIVDRIPGTRPASAPRNGFLLVWAGGDDLRLRDYRAHQSTPLRLPLEVGTGLHYVRTAWLGHRLVVTSTYVNQPILTVDLARPDAPPASVPAPCAPHDALRDLRTAAGAVIAICGGTGTEVVGMAG